MRNLKIVVVTDEVEDVVEHTAQTPPGWRELSTPHDWRPVDVEPFTLDAANNLDRQELP